MLNIVKFSISLSYKFLDKYLMKKFLNVLSRFINYRISIKELYFSLSSWFVLLVVFLGSSTHFQTSLLFINTLIALVVFVSIILITNRILLSCFLTLLIAVSFDYIKLIKWQFLMQSFAASDFLMLQLLFKHGLLRLIYEYATKEIYLIFLLLLINFILLWNKSDTLLDKKKIGIKNYYGLRVLSFGVAALLMNNLLEISANEKSYLYMGLNNIKAKHRKKSSIGPFADIVFSMSDLYIRPAKTTMDEKFILSKIDDNKSVTNIAKEEMPDIVVILNESVFNPKKLDYDFVDNFDFKFFKDNKYTKYSGVLNVNTYGGSSWISEYEINTGIPHKIVNGPSYMPFITMTPITKNSIMSYLKSVGYDVGVIYPVDKNFSLAQEAYTKLGSDSILDVYEYGFKPSKWSNVPDRIIGKMIIEALDKEPEKPKYIFAATMLNHGPHSSFKPDLIGCSSLMNNKLCSKLNDYISRLKKTDIDQMNLINSLMKRKKKTIIVNFGDHLPSFEGYSTQLRFTRDIKDYYKTFYNIHANFDIKDKTKYSHLDITFLPSLILDMSNLNNDKFYKAGGVIRKKCNGQLSECKKSSKEEVKDLYESYKSLISKQLEYNIDN